MVTAKEARNKLVNIVGKELAKKDQFIPSDYLENNDIFVFTSLSGDINYDPDKYNSWSVDKKTGEIKVFDVDKNKNLRKSFDFKEL